MSMSLSGNLAFKEHYQPRLEPGQTAILSSAGTFTIEDLPFPAYEQNEVVIKLEGCGVSGSNFPAWEGRPEISYPLESGAPGHEGWGEIVAVGERVYHLRPGQRVACLATNAFSKYVAVSAQLVTPIPDTLDGIPFPGEAIGCAMNIFHRADISRDHTVAIIGAGFLGLLLVQLAVDAGARVFVFSRRASVRKLAEKYGAEATFDTANWLGNACRVREITNGGCDRVIEMTGLQFALDAGTEMIAEYGKLIIGGYHQDGPRQIDMQKWNWRAIDVINAHERDPRHYIRGIEAGVIAVETGRIRPQDLLTHQFELEQINDAFQMIVDRPDGFIKGWIKL